MFSQIDLAKHRAKLTHAVASPQEQQRQLAALQSLILGLLGLGSESGLGRRWVMGGRIEDGSTNFSLLQHAPML